MVVKEPYSLKAKLLRPGESKDYTFLYSNKKNSLLIRLAKEGRDYINQVASHQTVAEADAFNN